VSLLLYLDDCWEREWDAETLFLDTPTDTGIVVRPKVRAALLGGCRVAAGWLPGGWRVAGGWLLGGAWVAPGWLLGGAWVAPGWQLDGRAWYFQMP
jgi:hypothetical protein